MTGKIRVHIDPKGYDEKPSGKEIGGIKSRLQKAPDLPLLRWKNWCRKSEQAIPLAPESWRA